MFKFGDSGGEGNIDGPTGLVICCNKVLATLISHILVYQLDGKFITRISNRGSGDLQFNIFLVYQHMNPIMISLFVIVATAVLNYL